MNKCALILVCIAAAACQEPAAPPAPPVENAPAASAHAATVHEHPAPHGGQVQSTPRGHIELTVDASGAFTAWPLDEELRPRAAASGRARVGLPGYAEVALAPAPGGALAGKGASFSAPDFPVVVTILVGDRPETARFAVHLGGAHTHPNGHASGHSIIGRIVDSSCLALGEGVSGDHAACAIRCIRGGAPIAIVEDGTGSVYIAVGAQGKSVSDMLLPLVGRRSELFGTIARPGGTQLFVVEEAVPEHDHAAREGGAVAMVGEQHLEVTADRAGAIRVYLSDAFRKPIAPGTRRGTVEIRSAGAAPLVPDGDHLTARFAAPFAGAIEATVRLPMDADPQYFVTFLLDPKDQGPQPVAGGSDVRIDVAGTYSPSHVVVKRGARTRLVFVKRDTTACTGEVVIDALGVRQKLEPLGETVVEIAPDKTGTLDFHCGMNMIHGTIEVRE